MLHKAATVVNIDWKPDKNGNVSLTRQIVSYVSKKIASGDWIIGQKLPSQRTLAQTFAVNRSTIVEALEELTAFGIIEGKFGHGTTIINNTWSLMMSNASPNWQKYIESGVFKANIPTMQTINRLEYVEGITRLGTGETAPELFPHDMFKKVLQRIPERTLSLSSYVEPLGLLELRKVLSVYLAGQGITASPSCILIVSGALQALQLISLCALRQNSTVFVEIPSFIKSINIFPAAGMKLCGVPMDSNGMMPWMIDKKLLQPETSILFTIPTFHNPTGLVMSRERRTELMTYCKTNCLPIIEDDVFRELWIDEPPPPPIKTLDKNGIVLYLGSISKSLAPGFRLGWLVGPESVIQRLSDVKMQIDYGASSLSQWAVTEWLESGLFEDHLLALRQNLRDRRNLALQTLATYFKDIATWNKPTGGYYVWLKLTKNISTDRLFDLALRENLLINPGSIYDFSRNKNLRISYAHASPDALVSGFRKLASIIRSMEEK